MAERHGDHTEIWDYIMGHGEEISDLEKRVQALEAQELPASAAEDAAVVAQYAKTYADGSVWEAACRVLARLALSGEKR